MADVKINLEATHKEFLASITAASKATTILLDQLQKMSTAHTQAGAAASKQATATQQATAATTQNTRANQQNASSMQQLGAAIGKTVAVYLLLFEAAKKVGQLISGTFNAAISNIDDFRKQAIGTAAAMTNIADKTQTAGQTWDQIFNQNLKATVGTFIELERLSARYFTSSIDLQLAYNAFAQRGIVIRKSELEQLAQLTDLILLLTQGQQTTIQVQEEIRSLINGTLRPTAQLGQLLKSYGKDIKDVGAEIRALQSLKPLEEVLRGAAAATKEIQTTFQAVVNGVEVSIRQISRIGALPLYEQLVKAIQRFTEFLNKNSSTIAGFIGIIGEALGATITKFERFLEQLLGGNAAAASAAEPFARLVAIVEALGIAIARVAIVLVSLLRDLPVLFASFKKGFDAPTEDGGFFDFLKPGETQIKKVTKGFEEMAKVLKEDLKQFGDTGFLDIQKRVDELIKSFIIASKKAKELKTAGQGDVSAPVFVAFKPSAEASANIRQLNSALLAAEDRLAKARRNAAELTVSAATDTDLQALRRDLALIEQGFRLANGTIAELRSSLDQVNQFLGDNLAATTKGAEANFENLSNRVQTTAEDIAISTFINLRAQLDRVKTGFEAFKAAAADARKELTETEVTPHLVNAEKAKKEAESTFNRILELNDQFVEKARAQLAEALKSGDAAKVVAAQANLTESLQNQESGNRRAEQQRDFQLAAFYAESRLALAKAQRLEEQETFQVATEQRKIDQEELRINQAINAEIGRGLQQAIKAREAILQVRQRGAAGAPRTRLEAEGGEIQTTRIALQVEIDKTIASLSVLNLQIQGLEESGTGAAREMYETSTALYSRIITLKEERDAAIAGLEHNRALATSWEAIGNAAQSSFETLSNALLNSFEGKKTDFVAAFKGIADSLFKDSLKDVFLSFKVTFQKGFENVMKNLGIQDSMASTLGPAFLAGFALIASFVLGQLMSGGSSGSAGNPQVGITSTEQVRGLIGGETQIPIGQIGESLQSALVPTNLLLSRIAAGVDRLSFGGIDPSIIESTISQSVSDALQIQLSAT